MIKQGELILLCIACGCIKQIEVHKVFVNLIVSNSLPVILIGDENWNFLIPESMIIH